MKYIDIHSHLNLKPLNENIEEVIFCMQEQGVATITVGVDYATSKMAIELAEKYPEMLWATVGLHPNDATASFAPSENEWAEFKKLAQNSKVVAIGECGLDYFRIDQPSSVPAELLRAKQKEIFKKQIELAIEISKPLMIHARPSKGSMDAYEDTLELLENYKSQKTNNKPHANFHFFVGNIEIAKRILDIGGTMSFDGPITFSEEYDEVIKFLPIESIMCETDAPFAAPTPFRGRMCEPWMVVEVVKKIAEIKGLPVETVEKAMLENAKRVFGVHV